MPRRLNGDKLILIVVGAKIGTAVTYVFYEHHLVAISPEFERRIGCLPPGVNVLHLDYIDISVLAHFWEWLHTWHLLSRGGRAYTELRWREDKALAEETKVPEATRAYTQLLHLFRFAHLLDILQLRRDINDACLRISTVPRYLLSSAEISYAYTKLRRRSTMQRLIADLIAKNWTISNNQLYNGCYPRLPVQFYKDMLLRLHRKVVLAQSIPSITHADITRSGLCPTTMMRSQ